MCAEVGQVRVDVDAAGHLRLRLAPCYTLLAQVLLPSGWKSSRKEYTALGSRPDMFTFSTGDTLLPLVVTIISLVSSLKRSPSPLSFRPKHSSRSLGLPSRCLPAPHFLRLSRWSTGYCRLFPRSRCWGSSSSCLPPPLCPSSPDLATREESHLHCSRWLLFQQEGPPASQTRLEGEERHLEGGGGWRGTGWGGYST